MTNILQKNWLIARQLEKEIAVSSSVAKGLLLDAGCGNKPYARFFKGKVDGHIGIDMGSFLVDENLDAFGMLQALPFRDSSFSTLLCTEALQHVPLPHEVIREFYRVLKKGGCLILSTTQMWHITNAPYDSYRFTEYGLNFLAEYAGFKMRHHKSLGSFWMRMGLKFCYFVHKFNRFKVVDLPIRLFLIIPQIFFLLMDKIFFDKKDVINHLIVLEKP